MAFAVAAGVGLTLYAPSGRWAERLGAARVLRAALATRALAAFAVVVLAWSPLSVVGTALAARLSPIGEGAGLGLFNGSTAAAGVAGAAAGGLVAGAWGPSAVMGLSAAGVALGLVVALAPGLTIPVEGGTP